MQYCNIEKAERERERDRELRKLECVTSSMSSCSCAVQRDATRLRIVIVNQFVRSVTYLRVCDQPGNANPCPDQTQP